MSEKVNPYESPRSPAEPRPSWWDRLRGALASRGTRYRNGDDATLLEFVGGRPIIFEGVAFLVDPQDQQTLYAAIALREQDPSLIDRCLTEVRRLLPCFADQFPDLTSTLSGRSLVVRFIDSYLTLDSEVSERRLAGRVDEFLSITVDASASASDHPSVTRDNEDTPI